VAALRTPTGNRNELRGDAVDPTSMASDAVTALRSVRWDTPFRVVSSIVALGTVAGASDDERPVIPLANAAEHLDATSAAHWLLGVDAWLVGHLAPTGTSYVLALVVVVGGVATGLQPLTVGVRRGSATMWICVALAAYSSGGTAPVWLALALALVIAEFMTKAESDGSYLDFSVGLAVRLVDLVVAAFYLSFALLTWAFGEDRVPPAEKSGN
jgi:hypothetical protein